MDTFNSQETLIIIAMVVIYIAVTTWMSLRMRSRTSEQYMVAGRTMPAYIVGILMMSEFIGANPPWAPPRPLSRVVSPPRGR